MVLSRARPVELAARQDVDEVWNHKDSTGEVWNQKSRPTDKTECGCDNYQ
jgi:hypothetical protein